MCKQEYSSKTKGRKFCSLGCSTSYRNLAKAKPYIKKICVWCAKEFEVEPHRKDAKFCGRSCAIAYLRRNTHVDFCITCKKPVVVNWYNKKSLRKYCSHECYYKDIGTRVHVVCSGCGVPLAINKSRASYYNKFYCTVQCHIKNGLKKTFGFVHKKQYDLLRSRLCSTASYLRWKSYILERDNYRCVQCGTSDELRVHHKTTLASIIKKYNPTLSLDLLDTVKNSPEFLDTNNGVTYCNSCHMTSHHSAPLSSN